MNECPRCGTEKRKDGKPGLCRYCRETPESQIEFKGSWVKRNGVFYPVPPEPKTPKTSNTCKCGGHKSRSSKQCRDCYTKALETDRTKCACGGTKDRKAIRCRPCSEDVKRQMRAAVEQLAPARREASYCSCGCLLAHPNESCPACFAGVKRERKAA